MFSRKSRQRPQRKKASASEFTVEMPEDKGEYYDIKNDPANFTDTRSVADEYYTVNDIISGNIVTLNGHELLCQIVNSEIGGEWGEEAIRRRPWRLIHGSDLTILSVLYLRWDLEADILQR